MVELVGGGSVIKGAYPMQFRYYVDRLDNHTNLDDNDNLDNNNILDETNHLDDNGKL